MLLYYKLSVICRSAERFNLHSNATSRVGAVGGKSYLIMSTKEKAAATVPMVCFVFNNRRLSNNAF